MSLEFLRNLFWEHPVLWNIAHPHSWQVRRRIHWFRQRGFDDTELWSLDNSLSEYIAPRLRAFREMPPMSFPPGLTYEGWLALLDEMLYAFEHSAYEFEEDYVEPENIHQHHLLMERGFRAFGDWYQHLWS